jgi:uncharacterized SAM-binding protein YcdF (DUF218 family)/DNA-binding transcriptional regulator YiaG
MLRPGRRVGNDPVLHFWCTFAASRQTGVVLLREKGGAVAAVQEWTGREAKALRRALRLSVRAFAEHLGVAVRTVSKWEALETSTQPRPDTQAILDTALSHADPAAQARFEQFLVKLGSAPPAYERLESPRQWDYETWTEDLERVIVRLSRQSFESAGKLLDHWLTRFEPRSLDTKGLYLHGRSLVLLGDMRRDQGVISGPASAQRSYGRALSVFSELDIPRRIAQINLSLAVVTEMAGDLDQAARKYQELSTDSRLGRRDRARARLWVGTCLSKRDADEYAARVIDEAIREFERIDEPDDWAVAHQKLALAHRGAGDLGRASRYIEISRAYGPTDSPMQKVRLATAHGHILLSDPATRDDGLSMLQDAANLAAAYSLTHQLGSIETIRRSSERSATTTPARRHEGRSVTEARRDPTDQDWRDAELIWDYHQMKHQLRPCAAAIGLGSHDLGVASFAAELYHAGLFPVLVFSGANSPTTAARFPRGEAVHYREHAIELDVPDHAILVEPDATNTGQNICLSRALLEQHGIKIDSLLLVSKPYMERRAFAACRKVWPDVEVVCASKPTTLDEYVKSIGNGPLVIDMLVGDLQRVIEYPKLGFAIEQTVPTEVLAAYSRLLRAGFDSRLVQL